MTSEEREALLTAFSSILASLSQLEMKTDAAIDALAQTVPAIHSEYQKALADKRTHVVNDLSTALEYLRRTLGRNTN
jgi:hypothetical protein